MSDKTKKNGIHRLSSAQARRLFDRQVRDALDISGNEFIRRWDQGKVGNLPHSEVRRLAMLIPLAR